MADESPPRAMTSRLVTARRGPRERGQAVLEFFFAILIAMMLVLGILQIALIFNAHSMVKLAAYNAARSAIVGRGYLTPDRSASWYEMKQKGKIAAFLTLLPVMPGYQAKAPTRMTDLVSFLDPASMSDRLKIAMFELLGRTFSGDVGSPLVDVIDVKFVDPADESVVHSGDEAPIDQWLSFDWEDSEAPDEISGNIIKVVVTWQYPLIVPFVNRIFAAIVRPRLWGQAMNAAMADTATQGITAQARLDIAKKKPAWAWGSSLEKVFRDPANSLYHLLDRIPVRASYVMRMQANRSPTWIGYEQMVLGEMGDQTGIDLGGGIDVLQGLQDLLNQGTESAQDGLLDAIGAPNPCQLVPGGCGG